MNPNGSTIIPTLRYKDAPKAIDWLCKAFGFERHLVVPGDNDTIAHAQLRYGNAMIMLGSDNEIWNMDINGSSKSSHYPVQEGLSKSKMRTA